MTVNSNSIIDLSSLQGQIANLVLSLNGLNQQQEFDPSYLPENETVVSEHKQKKEFIHDLENLIKFSDDTNPAEPSKGMSTYYISTYIYSALLALNKYLNEVTYETNSSPTKTKVGPINPIRPFAGTFSQDLFCIIKKDGFYEISKKDPTKAGENNIYDLIFKKENNKTNTEQQLTKREDLLDQDKLNSEEKNIHESWKIGNDEYKALVPVGLTTSDYNFGANMRKLLTDLYKEYYYYEILDIQKRLNQNDEGSSKLETELRLLLQKARNAFTREIYKPDVDITSEFPMSDIMYELNDYIAEMDSVDKYKNLILFNKEQVIPSNGGDVSGIDNSLNLYQFIEEKTHMMNMVGNAIHYGLELSLRIQRMKEYTDNINEDTITDKNPHFEQGAFSEDYCIKGIDEGMAMIRNLIDDLRLLTGDLEPDPKTKNPYEKLHLCLEHGLDDYLNGCNDIYYNFNALKTTSVNFKGESKFYDFNDSQLEELGVLKILDAVYQSHNLADDTNDIKTHSVFGVGSISRYDMPELYKNYALLIIKIVIMLGILHNFRIIQTYNVFKDVETTPNTRNVRDSKILTALNKPLPKDLSVMEFVKIEELKKQLRKKLSTRETTNDPLTLPTEINFNSNNDKALRECFKCILEIMNKMSETEITKDIDPEIIENLFKRFYPFTKSMLYHFDEYFTITNSHHINKGENDGENGENKFKINGNSFNTSFNNSVNNFNLLTNSLNYVAQGIVGSEIEKYTNEDFEKILTKLIYLCNCITVNWSYMDDAIHKDIDLSKTSIYNLFKEDFGDEIKTFDDLLKSVSTSIHASNGSIKTFAEYDTKTNEPNASNLVSGLEVKHLTTKFINFIHKEMKTMLQSDLPLVVKYVYWVVLYCINSYFIHLRTRFAHKVLTSKTITGNFQPVSSSQ